MSEIMQENVEKKLPWSVRMQLRVSDILTPLLLKPHGPDSDVRLTGLGVAVALCFVPVVIVGVLIRHPQRCWRIARGIPDPVPAGSDAHGFPNTGDD